MAEATGESLEHGQPVAFGLEFRYGAPVNPPSRQGQLPACLLALSLLAYIGGCEQVSSVMGRSKLPDLGPRLPATVRLEFDPSLTGAMAQYANACNQPEELRIGAELESVLLDAAYQNFQTVQTTGAGPAEPKPDVEAKISLEQSGLRLQTDEIYDRIPAELTLNALVVFKDRAGKIVAERPIKTSRRDRILLEPTQRRCVYVTMDSFLHDTAVALSTQFIREARELLDPGSSTAGPAQPASSGTESTPSKEPTLSFKATIFDDNGNLILESGERIGVRVEVVNTGKIPANGVSATLTGPPLMLSQFAASSLTVGTVQPGETRSLEFTATVPQAIQPQRVDLVVAVTEATGQTPPAQTLAAVIRPSSDTGESAASSSGAFDNVDRLPLPLPHFERRHTYVIAVGISVHRDQPTPVRQYAAMDAELVIGHFQALGGVPATNVRLLQDWKALRSDIEEAIVGWLPARATSDSTVIVYFAGQAKVTPSGDTLLVPYEGGRSSSRSYPFKDVLSALERVNARHVLFIFDGSVSKLDHTQAKTKDPQWGGTGGHVVRLIGSTGVHTGIESDKVHHSLFTYHLLRGLRGEADENADGEITLGELTLFLGNVVPDAARRHFKQSQRPLVIPSIPRNGKLAALPLTRSAPVSASSKR